MLLALLLVLLFIVSLLLLTLIIILSALRKLLDKLVELLAIGPVQTGRVSAAGSPPLVNVLVPNEALNLMRARVLARLLVVAGEVRFPEGIDNQVVHVFIHLDELGLPAVEVNRLHLRNVSSQVSVLPRAPQAHEGPKGRRGPPRSLGETVRAVFVGPVFQERLEDLDLCRVRWCLVT